MFNAPFDHLLGSAQGAPRCEMAGLNRRWRDSILIKGAISALATGFESSREESRRRPYLEGGQETGAASSQETVLAILCRDDEEKKTTGIILLRAVIRDGRAPLLLFLFPNPMFLNSSRSNR